MASELDPVNEAVNDDEKVVQVPPPKSKKVEKKAVMGETSMATPHQESHGPRQDAHAFIHPGSRKKRKPLVRTRPVPPHRPGQHTSAAHQSQTYGTVPAFAARVSRMTNHRKRISLRASTLTEVSSPTTGTSITKMQRRHMATTRLALSCPISASTWGQPGINSAPCMT
jgi:hypothetical protein